MAHYYLTKILAEIAYVIEIEAPYSMIREYYGKFSGAYMALFCTDAITRAEVDFYSEIDTLIRNEISDYYFSH